MPHFHPQFPLCMFNIELDLQASPAGYLSCGWNLQIPMQLAAGNTGYMNILVMEMPSFGFSAMFDLSLQAALAWPGLSLHTNCGAKTILGSCPRGRGCFGMKESSKIIPCHPRDPFAVPGCSQSCPHPAWPGIQGIHLWEFHPHPPGRNFCPTSPKSQCQL